MSTSLFGNNEEGGYGVETVRAEPIIQGSDELANMFARHRDVPGHRQDVLLNSRLLMIGAGGLNSWTGLGLMRSGVRFMTIVDHDLAEASNLPRQLYQLDDLGLPKAIQLARQLARHALAGAEITGVGAPFQVAVEDLALSADLLMVGVDNNLCRVAAVREARIRRVPAVFTMLSSDGMRCHAFLQGPDSTDACLWCALPNLDEEGAAPCAAAIISSCFLASAYAVFLAHRALMGWPENVQPYNWREADLLGVAPDRVGFVRQRPDCRICKDFR